MIRTDWFDGSKKPSKPGVYEREFNGAVYFAKWNGEHWSETWWTADEAEHNRFRIGQWQSLRWRGVVPEVLGCVPVDERERYTCQGCAFNLSDGRATRITRECIDAGLAAGTCIAQRIIWRPRSEVSNG